MARKMSELIAYMEKRKRRSTLNRPLPPCYDPSALIATSRKGRCAMTLVDGSPLRLRGVPDKLIKAYVEAAEAAWEDAALQLTAAGGIKGDHPSIWLRLKHPVLDPRTVMATVGVGGQFGAVEGTTPAALRAALAEHLRGRLV